MVAEIERDKKAFIEMNYKTMRGCDIAVHLNMTRSAVSKHICKLRVASGVKLDRAKATPRSELVKAIPIDTWFNWSNYPVDISSHIFKDRVAVFPFLDNKMVKGVNWYYMTSEGKKNLIDHLKKKDINRIKATKYRVREHKQSTLDKCLNLFTGMQHLNKGDI